MLLVLIFVFVCVYLGSQAGENTAMNRSALNVEELTFNFGVSVCSLDTSCMRFYMIIKHDVFW